MTDPHLKLEKWLEKSQKQEVAKLENKISRKIKNINADLIKLKSYPELYEIAKDENKLMSNLKLEHKRVRFKFKSGESFFQRADIIYQKAKRLKAALEIQEERLNNEKKKLMSKSQEEMIKVKPANLHWILNPTPKEMIAPRSDNKAKYYNLVLPGGIVAAIGASAQGNDYIRKAWAKKDDIWVHIENVTGSHLFLRTESISDIKVWELIGSVLRDHSNYKGEQITLVWTKVRNLKAVKGSPGLVRFSKEKRITVNYNDEWRNLLSLS